ncbi:MAG: hypothetical protein KJ718_03510 [Nanoarchaeota archaeon]|nr:hypothetical protein [Nanoarchaeota archaeon]MBU1051597.1 hypothetical protein [Nanoarchaeota archaeon]MBU1988904.1 hypothetical protein [Nanoarchaeota archaeon]
MGIRKKGLSSIVAIIAIILITIAAAGFIAGIIVPLVKNQLNEGAECLGYEDYFTFYEDFDYNCYENVSGNWMYGFSIEADSVSEEKAEKVKGFRLQFLRSGESIAVNVEDGAVVTNEMRMLDLSVENFDIPVQGEVRTYIYNSTELFDFVGISPLMESGRVCDETDKIDIRGRICTISLI